MFIAVQIPIVDLRSFNEGHHLKLSLPDWTIAEPGKDFIRHFGKIRKRPLRGNEWGGDIFCDAGKILRFEQKDPRINLSDKAFICKPKIIFTRLFKADSAVITFELGLQLSIVNFRIFKDTKHSIIDLSELIKKIFALKIKVNTPPIKVRDVKLIDIGKYIAELYLIATTKNPRVNLPNVLKNWVVNANPLVIVEDLGLRKYIYSKYAYEITSVQKHGIKLQFLNYIDDTGYYAEVWKLSTVSAQMINYEIPRSIRLYFWKDQAIRSGLKILLRSIVKNQINVSNKDISDHIQQYLLNSISFLQKAKCESNKEILETVLIANRQFTKVEVSNLMEKIKDIRPNVLRIVENYIKPRDLDIQKVDFYKDEDFDGKINDLLLKYKSSFESTKKGIILEEIFYSVLKLSNLDKIFPAYSIKTEQFDAAFTLHNQYFLVELKHEKGKMSLAQIAKFMIKLQGKKNAFGLFLSVNGYTAPALKSIGDSLSGNNLILLDGGHLDAILQQKYSFEFLLDTYKEFGAMYGEIYLTSELKRYPG